MKTSIIAGGVALAAIIGYYTYDILTDPSPAGQFAHSRLGLDKRPPLTDIYSNETEYGKALREQQRTREWVEGILRDVRNTSKPFTLPDMNMSRSNVGYSSYLDIAEKEYRLGLCIECFN